MKKFILLLILNMTCVLTASELCSPLVAYKIDDWIVANKSNITEDNIQKIIDFVLCRMNKEHKSAVDMIKSSKPELSALLKEVDSYAIILGKKNTGIFECYIAFFYKLHSYKECRFQIGTQTPWSDLDDAASKKRKL